MPTANRETEKTAPKRRNSLAGDQNTFRSNGHSLLLPVVLAALLTFSTGCTSCRDYVRNGFKVGPNYRPPVAPVSGQWIDSADQNISSGPAKVDAWWQTFNDPVLDYLICTAYRQNLSLRVACFRIIEARAQRGIAAGELFPQTQQAFGSYTRTNNSLNSPNAVPLRFYDEWQTGASLAWELDFWGQFRRAVEAADAKLDASIYNYDDVLVLLLSEVAQSYIDIRTAEQRLEYARQNVDIQKVSLNLAEVKFQNGATTRLDVTQGQSNLSQTEATIPPLEVTRRQAADQLCILLGMPPRDLDDVLGGRRAIPSALPQVAVGIPAELIRRRPDVLRAEREVAAQSALIGVATSDLYPHFSITGTIYYDATRFQDLFDARSFAGNVGPSFNWNILNYGRLVNNIRVQDARFQQLAYQYQNTVLKANAEAEDALVGFLKFQQQVKYLATSTQAATESLGLVRDQYNAGKTDFNRVLTVEQLLSQQEDLLAVAQGTVANNLVLLYKALGGGWQTRFGGPESQGGAATGQSGEQIPVPGPAETTPLQAPLTLPQDHP
ncbi:MAG: efflux transporter outer membrane subunit [Thermoguttaceae bacterium]|jgi:NodT family efflux transporter outer membrane factor (OMF) lipoprotein